MKAMEKSGGRHLVNTVMKSKRDHEKTFITQIHHRQTPMRIMAGESDAGPVWETEIRFQQMIGNPIDGVEIVDQSNESGIASAAILKNTPHNRAAEAFMEFLVSDTAASIYKKYGFEPIYQGNHLQ